MLSSRTDDICASNLKSRVYLFSFRNSIEKRNLIYINGNAEKINRMQVSDTFNVKIYNLSAGKSLPEVSYNFYKLNCILHTFHSFSGYQKEKDVLYLKKM